MNAAVSGHHQGPPCGGPPGDQGHPHPGLVLHRGVHGVRPLRGVSQTIGIVVGLEGWASGQPG